MQLAPGTRLGPYQIVEPLAAGGMGVVYRATDTRLARSVALKVISAEWAKDRQVRLRFEREARAISALSHPHICVLHDVGEVEGFEFLVMELVEGETLADRLRRGPLPIADVVQYGAAIADALEVAHARAITHRDIKPSNIMITPRGLVKILDFGVAKITASSVEESDSTDAMTLPGAVIGTVRYMAPEQTMGEEVTAASDIFSLGVVLYEALTGFHPFHARGERDSLQLVRTAEAVTPSALRPEIPQALDRLLIQMLAKHPPLRPPANAVTTALRELAGASVIPGPRPTRPARRIVGREKEQQALVAIVQRNQERVVGLTGEPGLGKTALVHQCLAELLATGNVAIGVGRCSERLAGTEAYLPILEALTDLTARNPSLSQALKLLAPAWHRQVMTTGPELPTAPRGPEGAAGQERLKRELASFFEEATRFRPVLMVLDDVHWSDASTVDLIGYLADRLDKMQLFLIVTARSSELLLQQHAFLRLTRELQTRGLYREIALHFLGADDVRRYLQLEFPGHQFPEEFQRLIYQKTEGNPLFMVDLLRYLRDQGVMTDDGGWRLRRPPAEIESEMPASVRSMIDRKIDQLNDEERRVLVGASVQGAEFDSAVVARALAIDPADCEDLLIRLDRVHEFLDWLEEQEFPDGTPTVRYRFVHVLYQNTLYGSLGPSRRASLSGKVAETLVEFSQQRTASIASQLGILFETARQFERAAEFFLAAAQHAGRLFANREAVLLARRGLGSLTRLPQGERRRKFEGALQELLGDVLELSGEHQEARRAYSAALDLVSNDRTLLRARIHRKTANVAVVQRLYPEAKTSFDKAEEVLKTLSAADPAGLNEWIQLQLDRIWMDYWQADIDAMDAIVERLEPHITTTTAAHRARFYSVRVLAGFRRERYAMSDQTLALSLEGIKAAQEVGDPLHLGMAQFQVGFIHMWRNQLDPAEEMLQRSLNTAEKIGDVVLQSRCLSYLTVTARKRLDDAGVRRWVERSEPISSAAGMREYVALAKANRAWLAWREGSLDEAIRLGEEALSIWRDLPLMHGPAYWTAGFPLIAALLPKERSSDAFKVAELLLGPTQHRLPDELTRALEDAVESGPSSQRGIEQLRHALDLARTHLYL